MSDKCSFRSLTPAKKSITVDEVKKNLQEDIKEEKAYQEGVYAALQRDYIR